MLEFSVSPKNGREPFGILATFWRETLTLLRSLVAPIGPGQVRLCQAESASLLDVDLLSRAGIEDALTRLGLVGLDGTRPSGRCGAAVVAVLAGAARSLSLFRSQRKSSSQTTWTENERNSADVALRLPEERRQRPLRNKDNLLNATATRQTYEALVVLLCAR